MSAEEFSESKVSSWHGAIDELLSLIGEESYTQVPSPILLEDVFLRIYFCPQEQGDTSANSSRVRPQEPLIAIL